MIYAGKRDITLINYGEKAISSVMFGAKLVWQAIRSCFGAGYWVNEKPWINEEGWKN